MAAEIVFIRRMMLPHYAIKREPWQMPGRTVLHHLCQYSNIDGGWFTIISVPRRWWFTDGGESVD